MNKDIQRPVSFIRRKRKVLNERISDVEGGFKEY